MVKRIISPCIIIILIICNYSYGQISDSLLLSINSAKNYLYARIDNELIFTTDSINPGQLIFACDNGMIFKENDLIIAIPNRSGRANIDIYQMFNEDTIKIGQTTFLVNNLPKPQLKIGGIKSKDIKALRKEELLSNDTLHIYFSDDILNSEDWYKIHSFTMGYAYGQFFISYDTTGNIFSREMKNAILKLRPGQEICIRAKIKTETNVIKSMPLFRTRVY